MRIQGAVVQQLLQHSGVGDGREGRDIARRIIDLENRGYDDVTLRI
jgi:hypothetical protein